MTNRPRPFTNLPLEKFLQPIFAAYTRSGVAMSLNKIENRVVFINIDKKTCSG